MAGVDSPLAPNGLVKIAKTWDAINTLQAELALDEAEEATRKVRQPITKGKMMIGIKRMRLKIQGTNRKIQGQEISSAHLNARQSTREGSA